MQELHPWNLKPKEAIEIQKKLCDRLILSWDKRDVKTIGGVDVSLKKNRAQAAIVIFRFPELLPIESVTANVTSEFPYIPGLLSFREGPVVLLAWKKLRLKPDVLMFDGQGIAHPRGIGIASHIGLWIGRPTVGVAKSRLYGIHNVPGQNRGEYAELFDEHNRTRVIGLVLRTRTKVKPVYVSPGHLIDIQHSLDIILKCCTKYRLPEPTRWAHRVAGGEPFS